MAAIIYLGFFIVGEGWVGRRRGSLLLLPWNGQSYIDL